MEDNEYQLFLCEYRYADPDDPNQLGTWDINIPARNVEEAQARLTAIGKTGAIVGVRSMAWLRREAADFLPSESVAEAGDEEKAERAPKNQ